MISSKAGIEHGVGEISQGSVRPATLILEWWPIDLAVGHATARRWRPRSATHWTDLGSRRPQDAFGAHRKPRRFLIPVAHIWKWILAGGVVEYLALLPGTVMLYHFTGVAALILSRWLPEPLIK
jgi:hypothetical protein